MATYFTSDTHFGHARVVSLSKRPFRNVREMDEALVRNWNDVVRDGDVVWHVGDFGTGDPDRLASTFARLAGEKRLVVGNHDEGNEAVLTLPWAVVERSLLIEADGQAVFLCHYPMRTWPGARSGAVHAFGHMHGHLRGWSTSLDVGVDCWGFRPVAMADLKRRLRTLPDDPLVSAAEARRGTSTRKASVEYVDETPSPGPR